jgi:hypothetical protein
VLCWRLCLAIRFWTTKISPFFVLRRFESSAGSWTCLHFSFLATVVLVIHSLWMFFFTLNFIISSSNFEELLGKAVPCSYVLCWAPSHRGVPRLARNHWGPWPSLFLPSE